MEPFTFTAIVAALSAGVATGVSNLGASAVMDAYQGLKATLQRRFGDDSEVVEAVDKLEKKPDSEGHKVVLKEELEAVKADEDPDVRQAAQVVMEHVRQQPGGETHVQNAVGSYIAIADRGSTATVSNINRHEDRRA